MNNSVFRCTTIHLSWDECCFSALHISCKLWCPTPSSHKPTTGSCFKLVQSSSERRSVHSDIVRVLVGCQICSFSSHWWLLCQVLHRLLLYMRLSLDSRPPVEIVGFVTKLIACHVWGFPFSYCASYLTDMEFIPSRFWRIWMQKLLLKHALKWFNSIHRFNHNSVMSRTTLHNNYAYLCMHFEGKDCETIKMSCLKVFRCFTGASCLHYQGDLSLQ